MIWPIVLLTPTVYMLNCLMHGSPHPRGIELGHVTLMFMLSGFSLLARRRMELQERQQFFRVHGLSANVCDLRSNLSQVEAHLNAMLALMGNVCDVVFRAGEDLR